MQPETQPATLPETQPTIGTLAGEAIGATGDVGEVIRDIEKLDAPALVAAIKSLHERLTRTEKLLHDKHPRDFIADWIGKL